MKLRKNKLHPLTLDVPPDRIEPASLAPWNAVRVRWSEMLQADAPMLGGQPSSFGKGWVCGPERMLQEYLKLRQRSVLGAIFKQANRMHERTDQVVVLGTREACCGARAIVEACCQPHWNELSRAERGSKPRVYFLDDPADNDQLQGLLYLLHRRAERSGIEGQLPWGLVVLDPASEDAGVRFAHQTMERTLRELLEGQAATVSDCIVSIAPASRADGKTAASEAIDHHASVQIVIQEDWPWSYGALSPAGLLPAALVGINVIELLQGASWMTQHAANAAADENLVVRLSAVRGAALRRSGRSGHPRIRMLVAWQSCLVGLCRWAEHIAQTDYSSVENTVWLRVASGFDPSNATMVQATRSVDLIEHLYVDSVRFDPLEFASDDRSGSSYDGAKWLPDLTRKQWADCNAMFEVRGTPSISMRLAAADELHVGQWMQWMMLCAEWERTMVDVQASHDGAQSDTDRPSGSA